MALCWEPAGAVGARRERKGRSETPPLARRRHEHAATSVPASGPRASAVARLRVSGLRGPRRVRILRRERQRDPHVAGHLRVPRGLPAAALRGAAAQVTHLLRQTTAQEPGAAPANPSIEPPGDGDKISRRRLVAPKLARPPVSPPPLTPSLRPHFSPILRRIAHRRSLAPTARGPTPSSDG